MSWVNPADQRVLFWCEHSWVALVSSSPDYVLWNLDVFLILISTVGPWTMWWTRMKYWSSVYWNLISLYVVIYPLIAQNNSSKLDRNLLNYWHRYGRKTVITITSNKTNIIAKIPENWEIWIIHINAYFCCCCC